MWRRRGVEEGSTSSTYRCTRAAAAAAVTTRTPPTDDPCLRRKTLARKLVEESSRVEQIRRMVPPLRRSSWPLARSCLIERLSPAAYVPIGRASCAKHDV